MPLSRGLGRARVFHLSGSAGRVQPPRRDGYPGSRMALGPETDAALQRLADTTGLAAGVLLREAIDAGLSVVRDRYRKRGA